MEHLMKIVQSIKFFLKLGILKITKIFENIVMICIICYTGVGVGDIWEVDMKKVVALLVVGLFFESCWSMYDVSNTDWEIKTLQNRFAPIVATSSFDREAFLSKLNPEVSKQMMEILDESLKGDDTCLEYCSGRVHAGLLNNKPLFRESGSVGVDQRDGFIYDISMQVLKKSIEGLLPAKASVVALKNILTYCQHEAKSIGLSDASFSISSIPLRIQ